MAANVETMAYVKFDERDVPWHGLGNPINHAMTLEEAMTGGGIGWNVESKPMFINVNGNMIEVPNTFANTRDSDNSVLGVVTGKYKIVQNKEAFDFTEALLGQGVKYETAGSLDKGRKVWILARMPETEILGDKVERYLVFSNSHDGKGSIHVACVNVRVVCQNTLNMALHGATRKWSTKHMGDMNSKLAEAHRTLELASKYNESFEKMAVKLAGEKFSMPKFTQFVQNMLPIDDDMNQRQKDNILLLRDDLNIRYNDAPDLGNFRGTKWGVFNAVSDFATHKPQLRSTETYKEKLFDSIIDSNTYMDKAMELLMAD